MLLTVKDLSQQLQIKPATLYAWAAQQKIPCLKIHGVIRFESERIREWLNSFGVARSTTKIVIHKRRMDESVDSLIARAKRAVYTSGRGNQTNSEPK
jgi:predicted DNA-binding transcriptional regulator AlpA